MKLYWRLHKTTELHSDLDLSEADKVIRSAVGQQFHGNSDGQGWQLSHIDRNFFRPALRLEIRIDEDGTLIRAEYRMDKTLLIFMCIWSALVIVFSLWKGWLLLVTLLFFWGAVFIGFANGVRQSDQELMALLSAYEIEA